MVSGISNPCDAVFTCSGLLQLFVENPFMGGMLVEQDEVLAGFTHNVDILILADDL